jgi:hypothetical protein
MSRSFTLIALSVGLFATHSVFTMEKEPSKDHASLLRKQIEEALTSDPLEFTDVSKEVQGKIEEFASSLNAASPAQRAKAIGEISTILKKAKTHAFVSTGVLIAGMAWLFDKLTSDAAYFIMGWFEIMDKVGKQIEAAIKKTIRIAERFNTKLSDEEVEKIAIDTALSHATNQLTTMYALKGGNIYHVALAGIIMRKSGTQESNLLKTWLKNKIQAFAQPGMLMKLFATSELNVATQNAFAMTPLFMASFDPSFAEIVELLIQKGATDTNHVNNILRLLLEFMKQS